MVFLGTYSAAQAIIAIFDNYVKPNNSQLQYLLTYKFSQDHLELFFCAIRACGGWCPNPHSAQFSSAYKRLVIHHEIKTNNGNVEMQDNTKILTVSSTTQRMARLNRYDPAVYNEMANLRVCKKYLLDDELLCNQSFNNVASLDTLSEITSDFSNNSVAYICGFVIRKVWIRIKCESCRESLICINYDNINSNYSSISIDAAKNNLCYHNALRLIMKKSHNIDVALPSEAAYNIIILTEQLFRRAINCNRGLVPTEPQFGAILCLKVLKELVSNSKTICNIFPDLNNHIFDDTVEELSGHLYTLAKTLVIKYIDVRMFSLSKICTLRQTGLNLRHYTNRQLVWMHQ